jgi:hypothetical protein
MRDGTGSADAVRLGEVAVAHVGGESIGGF